MAKKRDDVNLPLMCERLKKIRKKAGLSQEGAENAIGAGKGIWAQWEKGIRIPRETSFIAIAAVFNTNPGYLKGNTDNSDSEWILMPSANVFPSDIPVMAKFLTLTKKEKDYIRQAIDILIRHREDIINGNP